MQVVTVSCDVFVCEGHRALVQRAVPSGKRGRHSGGDTRSKDEHLLQGLSAAADIPVRSRPAEGGFQVAAAVAGCSCPVRADIPDR